ncbi:MAG: isoprenyl transferase [Candidatus Bipolaricaulota bacterium]
MTLEDELGEVKAGDLPEHVAVIPDGNGRWAHSRGLERTKGHKRGTRRAEDLIEFISANLPIKYLTFYTFSTENWSRPDREVEFLMTLLKDLLGKKGMKLLENDVRLRIIGEIDDLPDETSEVVKNTIDMTADNDGLQLIMALNYGARQEIIRAVQKLARRAASGELSPEEVTEDAFENHLFTAGIPDPDLLIRTSGERRVSNFMLWQLAYTEIWITNRLWPSFEPKHLLEALSDFQRRERRYGDVNSEETQ